MQIKPYRKNSLTTFTIGVYPSLELVKYNPEKIRRILIDPKGEKNSGVDKLLDFAHKTNLEVITDAHNLYELAKNENSYALVEFEKFDHPIIPSNKQVVLHGIRDGGNLGNIMRTMHGLEVFDLAVIEPAVDRWDPKVVRASMGSCFSVRCTYYINFDDYLRANPGNEIYPFMTDGENLLHEVQFGDRYALVFGNESEGLPTEFLKIGKSVRISQSRTIDSLNLSSATCLGIYQAQISSRGR